MRLFPADRPDLYVEVSEPRGPLGRMRGLIGSRSPGPRRGMLLKTRQVHTFGMSFPIDAVYVSAEGLVLKVRTLPPARMGPLVWGARWVLEMEAGEAQRVGISEGAYLLQEKAL